MFIERFTLGSVVVISIMDPNLKLFCDKCGTLIYISAKGEIRCQLCNSDYDCSLLGHFERTITLQEKVEEKQPEMTREMGNRSKINERCPECGHEELYFSTAQLRSADEGQTVFYECPECHHKWQQNA